MATKPTGERSKISAELNATLGSELLRETAEHLEDRAMLLSKIADFAQRWEKSVFASGGAVAGTPWKPLAQSTPGRQLIRSGALRRMLTGLPRIMKASVQIRGPEYATYLKGGRFAKNSAEGTGRRRGVKGLGGSMPRRNPTPRPPRDQLAILTADLLGMVTPDGAS